MSALNPRDVALNKKQRTTRFGKSTKWLAFVVSTLIAFLCAEVALRCVWHNPYRFDEPDRVVKLRLQHANTHHRIDRSSIDSAIPIAELRTDERSYILPSTQHQNPHCSIAFLGGSTTECFAVDESVRFPAIVSQRFFQRGLRVNTLNSGTSGNTVHDSLNNLLNHVVEDAPNMVVMMHACNDIGVLSEAGNYRTRGGRPMPWTNVLRTSLMRLTSHSFVLGLVRQVTREHTYLVPTAPSEIKNERSTPHRLDEVAGQYEQRLRAFIRICKSFEMQPVLMTQPMSDKFTSLTPQWANESAQERFNQTIRRVGQEEDAMVIDLAKHLQQSVPGWDEHMNLFYDGVHVTDEGSRVYAEYIAQQLFPVVQGLVSPNSDDQQRGIDLADRPRANR